LGRGGRADGSRGSWAATWRRRPLRSTWAPTVETCFYARSGRRTVGEREVRAVVAFPELRRLCLSGVTLNDGQIAIIAALSKLESLDLAGVPIGDGALARLAPLERL
jgi:hypothetical protein